LFHYFGKYPVSLLSELLVIMDSIFIELGYIGLFLIAFISATLIPAATEVFMLAMVGLEYSLLGLLVVATIGNVLGAIFNYYIGRRGVEFLNTTRFAPKAETIERAQRWFRRWGTPVLFFSWLPFVGDPLTLVAGLMKLPLRPFLAWVTTGRLLRYAAILSLTTWL
jgi:membrane protein YqaA with SNARE-associated domain